ncbi:hypothetical protein ABTN73_19390, partial [Acinetobacter baumannii]
VIKAPEGHSPATTAEANKVLAEAKKSWMSSLGEHPTKVGIGVGVLVTIGTHEYLKYLRRQEAAKPKAPLQMSQPSGK